MVIFAGKIQRFYLLKTKNYKLKTNYDTDQINIRYSRYHWWQNK